MIGETGGVTTTINSERIFRENSGEETRRREGEGEVTEQAASSDTVSISAEAIALARNVPPAGEASEAENNVEAEQGEQRPPELHTGEIDIRV